MKLFSMILCAVVLFASSAWANHEGKENEKGHGHHHGHGHGKGAMGNPEMHEKMKTFLRAAREKHWAFQDKQWEAQKSFHEKTTKDHRDVMRKLEADMDANSPKDHKPAMMSFRKGRQDLIKDTKKKREEFKAKQEKDLREFREEQRKARMDFFKQNNMDMSHHGDSGADEE